MKLYFSMLLFGLFAVALRGAQAEEINFNRDIRPILVDKCFACHGPDAETVAAGLRVDLREQAIASNAIVPGDAAASELIARVFAVDDDVRMPPPESHKELSNKEKALLRSWIEAGAEYQIHWSYLPIQKYDPPSFNKLAADHWTQSWIRNPVDRFIGAKILVAKTSPSDVADRVTLIRRLSFDLTGLPPTTEEVQSFVSDTSANAYEDLVDRLLASPRFGERMAIYWLDLVRYADTVGYHGDQNISQSPYRDYVIRAFNSNMRYDRFVREQLAGDLLPNPTIDQLVASGYNRLNQTTEEGGAQPKEYLAIYFADRVRNVSQTFMGATVGCAQCHDHKFDPYTAKDFYSLGAFFADIEEVGKYGARSRPPMIPVPTDAQKRELGQFDKFIDAAAKEIELATQTALSQQTEWEKEVVADPTQVPRQKTHLLIDDDYELGGSTSGNWSYVADPVHRGAKSRKQTSDGLVQHVFDNATKKITVDEDTVFYAWVFLDEQNPPSALMLQINDGSWEHRGVWGSDAIPYGKRNKSWAGYFRRGKLPATGDWVRLEIAARDIGLSPGRVVDGMAFTQFGGLVHWDDAGWVTIEGLPQRVAGALAIAPNRRTDGQAKQIRDHYLGDHPTLKRLRTELSQLRTERQRLLDSVTKTVVSKSVKPREIRVLHRGNWMDDSGQIVQPAIPEFMGRLETTERATRLDLAKWLCEPENVLTSRVMVNRLWYLMFGRGICTSVDDLGGQGTFPSNPELLDWLAHDFVAGGWDIKRTLKTIVMSATYRQSSHPRADLAERDPYNDLFARQGRFRIDAEMVRDAALAISGLLVEELGGRSVKPYQPAGYYAELNFPVRKYQADPGKSQYRRGLYTHWQRTFLHPMLKAFDAPSREEGVCSRARSNTPLQALTLLNDPTFIEAARVFAARVMDESSGDTAGRINAAYKLALNRTPDAAIVNELEAIFDNHRQQYAANPAAAKQLIATGNAPVRADLDPAELAAWTSVARVILNLHEVITRY